MNDKICIGLNNYRNTLLGSAFLICFLFTFSCKNEKSNQPVELPPVSQSELMGVVQNDFTAEFASDMCKCMKLKARDTPEIISINYKKCSRVQSLRWSGVLDSLIQIVLPKRSDEAFMKSTEEDLKKVIYKLSSKNLLGECPHFKDLFVKLKSQMKGQEKVNRSNYKDYIIDTERKIKEANNRNVEAQYYLVVGVLEEEYGNMDRAKKIYDAVANSTTPSSSLGMVMRQMVEAE